MVQKNREQVKKIKIFFLLILFLLLGILIGYLLRKPSVCNEQNKTEVSGVVDDKKNNTEENEKKEGEMTISIDNNIDNDLQIQTSNSGVKNSFVDNNSDIKNENQDNVKNKNLIFSNIENLSPNDNPYQKDINAKDYIPWNFVRINNTSPESLNWYFQLPDPYEDNDIKLDNVLKILIEEYNPSTFETTHVIYNGFRKNIIYKDTANIYTLPCGMINSGEKIYLRFKYYFSTVSLDDPTFANLGAKQVIGMDGNHYQDNDFSDLTIKYKIYIVGVK